MYDGRKARLIASGAVIVRRETHNVPLPLTAGNQTLLGETIREWPLCRWAIACKGGTPETAFPYSSPQECLIARSQREWDVVSIPADDDCARGNQARFSYSTRSVSCWTHAEFSVTLKKARIASLRMPFPIGSTINCRVSSGAMLFGNLTNHSDADALTSRPIRFSPFPKNACFP